MKPVHPQGVEQKNMKKKKEDHIEGFLPEVGPCPRVLILGTFPGEESLQRRQYYANARNLFWDMMGQVCEKKMDGDYDRRINILKEKGIALWDVLKSCNRHGSLDANIRRGFYEVNDFKTFLAEHEFKIIFFNGKKAEAIFARIPPIILPKLPPLKILPSTSPANARIPRDVKDREWLLIRNYLRVQQGQ